MRFRRGDFPEGFVFGTATSAYQIEGSALGGAGPCHWDTFSATPGNVIRAEDGARACEHLTRWPEDLDLVRDGNFDAYRFSVNWARVLPEGRGAVNAAGLDFYDRLLDGMLERGLQPWLTLYHWDMPSDLAMRGGWTNPDVAGWFTDYARLVMGRLGDRLAATATINEPWCVAWLSHFLGVHAPGLRDIRAAAHAMHHVLLAHGTALQALRADGHQGLGIVLNMEVCAPASDAPEDIAAAGRQDAIFNRWFLQAITQGTYPAEALEGLAPHLPRGWQGQMAQIAQPLDWLGLNYYTRRFHEAAPGTAWPASREVPGPGPKTGSGWDIYPDGLEQFLLRTKNSVGDLPIHVTETGMAWPDQIVDGSVTDAERIAFMEAHLAAAGRALKAGVNLGGFFCWSLLDNYEWAEGYDKRFGLVHVDTGTLSRRPKASYLALADALTRSS